MWKTLFIPSDECTSFPAESLFFLSCLLVHLLNICQICYCGKMSMYEKPSLFINSCDLCFCIYRWILLLDQWRRCFQNVRFFSLQFFLMFFFSLMFINWKWDFFFLWRREMEVTHESLSSRNDVHSFSIQLLKSMSLRRVSSLYCI